MPLCICRVCARHSHGVYQIRHYTKAICRCWILGAAYPPTDSEQTKRYQNRWPTQTEKLCTARRRTAPHTTGYCTESPPAQTRGLVRTAPHPVRRDPRPKRRIVRRALLFRPEDWYERLPNRPGDRTESPPAQTRGLVRTAPTRPGEAGIRTVLLP